MIANVGMYQNFIYIETNGQMKQFQRLQNTGYQKANKMYNLI